MAANHQRERGNRSVRAARARGLLTEQGRDRARPRPRDLLHSLVPTTSGAERRRRTGGGGGGGKDGVADDKAGRLLMISSQFDDVMGQPSGPTRRI